MATFGSVPAVQLSTLMLHLSERKLVCSSKCPLANRTEHETVECDPTADFVLCFGHFAFNDVIPGAMLATGGFMWGLLQRSYSG